MKKVQVETIQEKTAADLIDDLNHCRYSILDSIGCRKLRLEMFLPGLVSAIIVRYLVWKAKRKSGNNWTATVRGYLIKLFKRGAPYRVEPNDKVPINTGGIVIGFNHPSLGEILRLIALVSKHYPYNSYLFPVNLPWYEALCPVVDKMEEAGFKLTPIVTPSTRKKILKVAGTEMAKIADDINVGFNHAYLGLAKEFINNGDIVIVAPSATRQEKVFRTDAELAKKEKIEPGTMSLLATNLSRGVDKEGVRIIPIAVNPPAGAGRGLNLRSFYRFGIAEPFTLGEAVELTKERYGDFRGRLFDYEFLARIAVKLFTMHCHGIIAPFKEDYSMNGLAEILEESKKVVY
ncbi:hypothetical protein IJ768_01330 [Candidatus Saccharibacteria bacterium]|nr:hypothetical protein [Candidatus Saccharibacteria bacterium]